MYVRAFAHTTPGRTVHTVIYANIPLQSCAVYNSVHCGTRWPSVGGPVEADRGTDLHSLVSESFALDPVVILGRKKSPVRKLNCDLGIHLFNRDHVKTKEIV